MEAHGVAVHPRTGIWTDGQALTLTALMLTWCWMVDSSVGFWAIFVTKVILCSLKWKLPIYFIIKLGILNSLLAVFSDCTSSFKLAVVAHRINQDYSTLGLRFKFWWTVWTQIATKNEALSCKTLGTVAIATATCYNFVRNTGARVTTSLRMWLYTIMVIL